MLRFQERLLDFLRLGSGTAFWLCLLRKQVLSIFMFVTIHFFRLAITRFLSHFVLASVFDHLWLGTTPFFHSSPFGCLSLNYTISIFDFEILSHVADDYYYILFKMITKYVPVRIVAYRTIRISS